MMHWLLESDVFGEQGERLADAVRRAGHRLSRWKDDWWTHGRFPIDQPRSVLFHGSLGNASRIARELDWEPGAYCDVEAFTCSSYAGLAREWLLNDAQLFTTVRALVEGPELVRAKVGTEEIFVRPDSPLKPFSGRVVVLDGITARALDFGFYFDDLDLPIVVAPKKSVGAEWRFVVADGAVIAGSEYDAAERRPVRAVGAGEAWEFAQEIAGKLPAPERVYVLDVCETPAGLRLLELNPFSGADLYYCDPDAIVRSVSTVPSAGA